MKTTDDSRKIPSTSAEESRPTPAAPATKGVISEEPSPKAKGTKETYRRCKQAVEHSVDTLAEHSAKDYKTGYKKAENLLHSFRYALGGLLLALKNERNFRIHAFVAGYMLFFARYYNFSKTEYGVLLLTIGLVFVCELLNTSIEKAVDLASPGYNTLAKQAKDVAAGAVLVSSLISVAVGIYFFWDIPIFLRILEDVKANLFVFVPVIVLTIFLIFLPELLQKRALKENSSTSGTSLKSRDKNTLDD